MITLECIRLVNWYNIEDIVMEIGNPCLLAGDISLQIINPVPLEKIEAIGPCMDRINRSGCFGCAVKIRDPYIHTENPSEMNLSIGEIPEGIAV